MGKDYSSVDNAFGFKPYGNVLRTNLYAVQTAPGISIAHYDIVKHGGAGVSTPHCGTRAVLDDADVLDGSDANFLGSVLAVYDHNMDPPPYIAKSAAGNSTIAGYVLVADHPDQLFIAQEDGGGNAIDTSEIGLNADLLCASSNACSTTTGISTQEIDSSSADSDTSGNVHLKLIAPHEDDTVGNDSSANARWIVQINTHFYGTNKAGA